MSRARESNEATPLLACTVSHGIEDFSLLFEDLTAVVGTAWGDLRFGEVLRWLGQPEARSALFLVFALDEDDLPDLPAIIETISHVQSQGVHVVTVADDLPQEACDALADAQVGAVLPYPGPKGALAKALAHLPIKATLAALQAAAPERPARRRLPPLPNQDFPPRTDEARASPDPGAAALYPRPPVNSPKTPRGFVLAVQGLAGGAGTTTLAVTLAHALREIDHEAPPSVCLLDLDLQFGMVAHYLDLVPRRAVSELVANLATVDAKTFRAALQYNGSKGPMVQTAPPGFVSSHVVHPADAERLIALARAQFDYVVIDMPRTINDWTKTIRRHSSLFLAVVTPDRRSIKNNARLLAAIEGEPRAKGGLRYVVNRVPRGFALGGRRKTERLLTRLGALRAVRLPDGGDAVRRACNAGEPLTKSLPRSALTKAIRNLARELHPPRR